MKKSLSPLMKLRMRLNVVPLIRSWESLAIKSTPMSILLVKKAFISLSYLKLTALNEFSFLISNKGKGLQKIFFLKALIMLRFLSIKIKGYENKSSLSWEFRASKKFLSNLVAVSKKRQISRSLQIMHFKILSKRKNSKRKFISEERIFLYFLCFPWRILK